MEVTPNPIVVSFPHSLLPDWQFRQYMDGTWDAVPRDPDSPAISPVCDSFLDAAAWVREEENGILADRIRAEMVCSAGGERCDSCRRLNSLYHPC